MLPGISPRCLYGRKLTLRISIDIVNSPSLIIYYRTVEVNVGLICACLMLLPAFLNHVLQGPVLDSMSRLFSGAFGKLSGRRSQESKSPIGNRDTWAAYVEQRDSDSQFKGLHHHEVAQK